VIDADNDQPQNKVKHHPKIVKQVIALESTFSAISVLQSMLATSLIEARHNTES